MVRFTAGNRLASRQAAEREAAILQELSDLPYILTYRGHITASRACFLFTECAPGSVAGAAAHLPSRTLLTLVTDASQRMRRLLQGQPMTDVFDDLIAAGTTLEQRAAAMPDFAVQLLTVRLRTAVHGHCERSASAECSMNTLCVQALAQVHARCFVHGDVTAANVFMCESAPGAGGTIKLIDFGHAQITAFSGARRTTDCCNELACIMSQLWSIAACNAALGLWAGVCGIAVGGTPEYMAPETLEHLAGGRCAADLRKAGKPRDCL